MSQRQFFSRVLFASILFSSITPLFGMEEVPPKEKEEADASVPRPQRAYISQQSFSNASINDHEFGPLNKKVNKALFNESMKNAPDEVKFAFDVLSNPNAGKAAKAYQLIGLVGPSGSGKSTLAKAIAYKLGRDYLFVPAPVLAKHWKNHTSETILALFRHLKTYPQMPVLILDEVNKLVDDHKQKNSDSGMSATAAWESFDDNLEEQNVLIIATSNDLQNMPHQFQRRFSGHTYEVPHKSLTLDLLNFTTQEHSDYPLSDECKDNAFIADLIQRCGIFSIAEINTMFGKAGAIVLVRQGKEITRQDLNTAYAEIIASRQLLNLTRQEESNEDRRQRLALEQTQRIADRANELARAQMEQTQRNADRANRLAIIQAEFQAKVGRLNAWKSKIDQERAALNAFEPGAGEATQLLQKIFWNPREYSDYYNQYHQEMLDQIAALDRPVPPTNIQPQTTVNRPVTNKSQVTNETCSIF